MADILESFMRDIVYLPKMKDLDERRLRLPSNFENEYFFFLDREVIHQCDYPSNQLSNELSRFLSNKETDFVYTLVEVLLQKSVRENSDKVIPMILSFRKNKGLGEEPYDIYLCVLKHCLTIIDDWEVMYGIDLTAIIRVIKDVKFVQPMKEIINEKINDLLRIFSAKGLDASEIYSSDNDALESFLTPLQFEQRVADEFQRLGFTSYTTKGSGDQGADVIADYNGTVHVVQCKMYSGTVGNKAVQEVYAAKGFYNADGAVVVTTGIYSKSANSLAQKLGVILIHYDDLKNAASINSLR